MLNQTPPLDPKIQGFLAHTALAGKRNPALLMADETVIKMKVGPLTALLRSFYDAGYVQAKAGNSMFDEIFGKEWHHE